MYFDPVIGNTPFGIICLRSSSKLELGTAALAGVPAPRGALSGIPDDLGALYRPPPEGAPGTLLGQPGKPCEPGPVSPPYFAMT